MRSPGRLLGVASALVTCCLACAGSWGRSVALSRSTPTAEPKPLVELQRIELEPPFAAQIVSDSLSFSADGRVVYATSREDLFVVSAADGTVRDVLSLRDPGGGDPWGFRVALAGTEADPLLVAWNDNPAALRVYSLADPEHPTHVGDLAPGTGLFQVLAIPGTSAALALGKDARVVDLRSGEVLHAFARRTSYGSWEPSLVGGPTSRPRLALRERGLFSGSYRSLVDLYDVSDPARPAILGGWDGPNGPDRLAFARTADIVVSCGFPCEVRSTLDGALVSSFPRPTQLADLVVAEGDGARAAVLAHQTGVDIVDLADPSAPGEPRTVEAALYPGTWNGWRGLLAPSATAPIVAVALYEEGAVLVLDLRTAEVVARWDAGGPRPALVHMGDGPAGARTAAVVSMRLSWEEVFAPGGVSQLDLLDLGTPASPNLAGRVLRPGPRDIHAFGVLERGLAVAADPESNALALLALEDGRVLDTTGFSARLEESYDHAMLFARGRTVLVVGSGRWQVFDVRRGRLVSRAHGSTAPESATHGGVLPDGTAVVWTRKRLLTFLPDGRTGELQLEDLGGGAAADIYWLELEVAPSGDAVFVFPGIAVSLSDPARPVVAWRTREVALNAAYVDGGRSVLITLDWTGASFRTRLYDVASGEPRGPASEPIEVFFYHGMGTAFGEGASSRAVLWRWTVQGWRTVLLDVSGGTPTVIAVLPEFFAGPEYLARSGGGWYEFRNDGWDAPSEILVSLGDEAQSSVWELTGRRWWHSPRAVRPGVLAAVEAVSGRGLAISVWGDPSVARATSVVRDARR